MAEKQTYESQKERWFKYGANVAVATIVVIALAAILVYLAQKTGRRIDTTDARTYSLKPQTINILNDVKAKTTLVGLYRKEIKGKGGKMIKSPYVDSVSDLLEEYRRKSSKIDVQLIDPVEDNQKVETLIDEVSGKYGGEVQKYKKVTDSYKDVSDRITKLAGEEAQKVAKLELDKIGEDDDAQLTSLAIDEIRKIPKRLKTSDEDIQRMLADKPPNYKGAVGEIEDRMKELSQRAQQVIDIFKTSTTSTKYPEPIKQYITTAGATYEQLKKIGDDFATQTKDLGELKLDDLRTSLKARDVILVIGESDLRVIPFEQVWTVDNQELKQIAPGQEIKPRFAGEQQVSTAIHALTAGKKQKVCFVRNSGPPLTTPGMFPFRQARPFSEVAARLRDYNFDVTEKDLSGMWAMQQAQMQQQMPTDPEPSDEQIKDAIWVVLNIPMGQQNPMMPPPTMSPKVAEHLKNGGSALIVFWPSPGGQADNMPDVLKEWGIEIRTDAIAVHQVPQQVQGRQGDPVEQAQRHPAVFSIREYGDHAITRPLRSLESWLAPLLPVKTTTVAGVKTTPIIPIPTEPPSWGESDADAVFQMGDIKFDADKDLAAPIYGGAVAEKEKGGRVVVIGSPTFAMDRFIKEPDPDMLERGWEVARFPANADLFANSMFWLAKMEPMIAISPKAMEVSRIEPMSKGALSTWRNGVLLVLLPAAIVLAGAMVWFARRD